MLSRKKQYRKIDELLKPGKVMVREILNGYGVGRVILDSDSSKSYSVDLAVLGIDRIFLHDPGANDTFINANVPDADLDDAVWFHFGYSPLMKKRS